MNRSCVSSIAEKSAPGYLNASGMPSAASASASSNDDEVRKRGSIISTEKLEGFVQAMAEVPLNDMFGYSTDLRSATQGKGEFTMEFQKYAEVPKQQREVMMAEFRNKKEKESGAAR